MIKALFFDIDGTLVSFHTHTVPQSTVEAIAKAKQRGVEIYISTGRPYSLINNIAPIRHLVDGYVTTNGAYCIVGDKVVSCSPIDPSAVQAVVRDAHSSGFPCMLVGEHSMTMFNTACNPGVVEKISRQLNVPDIVNELPLQQVMSEHILQLTPFIGPEKEAELLKALPSIEGGRWSDDFCDFTARGVSKAKGLADVAAYRGFDTGSTMAFGDGGNDLSIIRRAGVGVAMANANGVLINNADYITTTVDDDGIFNALKHFGLI